jgi:hypothetical protein
MTEEQVNRIIGMNQSLCMLLGYVTGMIITGSDPVRQEWFESAIENVIYLNKPIPPFPKD